MELTVVLVVGLGLAVAGRDRRRLGLPRASVTILNSFTAVAILGCMAVVRIAARHQTPHRRLRISEAAAREMDNLEATRAAPLP